MSNDNTVPWQGPRRIVNLYDTPYEPYDLEGEVQDNVHLLNISYDRDRATGWYVIRMEPGTASIPHEHAKHEEYLILEGELIESDGTVLKKGDFISYSPGSFHNSRTETGCLLIGHDRDPVGEHVGLLHRVRREHDAAPPVKILQNSQRQ